MFRIVYCVVCVCVCVMLRCVLLCCGVVWCGVVWCDVFCCVVLCRRLSNSLLPHPSPLSLSCSLRFHHLSLVRFSLFSLYPIGIKNRVQANHRFAEVLKHPRMYVVNCWMLHLLRQMSPTRAAAPILFMSVQTNQTVLDRRTQYVD